jgi:transposase
VRGPDRNVERQAGAPDTRPASDRRAYLGHNVVERRVDKVKQWRCITIRYQERAANYRAMVVIASLMMWLPS